MLRFLISVIGAITLSCQALACDMRSESRASELVDYISMGHACLSAPPDSFRFDEQIEQQFERAINTARKEAGLPRLKVRSETRAAARFHSLDMGVNGYFSHASPAGLAHHDRIAAFDRQLLSDRSAENVAVFGPAICKDQNDRDVSCLLVPGFEIPSRSTVVEKLHQELMDSEGHRENILDPKMTHMVVGVARTDTGFHVTQLFVSLAGTLDEDLPVRLEPGKTIESTATLDGWDDYRFALQTEETPIDLKSGKLPRDISGDVTLNVRAEKSVEEKSGNGTLESLYWIYLSGPRFAAADR